MRNSILSLIDRMDFTVEPEGRQGDVFGLMQFSRQTALLTPVTAEKEKAIEAADALEQGTGDSYLWNSLYLALSETPEKGVILLITNGQDTGSIMTPLYVRAMAQMKGIPIYTVLVKTSEPDLSDEQEEYFRTFSEITGGRCYAIDATNPETDVEAGVSMGLIAAYERDRQNSYLFYNSSGSPESSVRYVKLIYSPEGREPVESETVSYEIPVDTGYAAAETGRHFSLNGAKRFPIRFERTKGS